MRSRLLAGVAVALTLVLAGCSSPNDALVDDYESGGNTGFISGDGRRQEIPVDQRGEPVSFTGTAVDGSTVSSADYAGEILVLNFWYAGCGPCRAEAPILEKTAQQTAEDGVHFLGVNIYDGAEQATAFEQSYGITYPSLLARQDPDLLLAFASWTSVQATPTTLVLDAQGRVAARFIGAVQDDTSLPTIIADVRAEAS